MTPPVTPVTSIATSPITKTNITTTMDYHLSLLTYHHHIVINKDGKREVEQE
jgi:hypothetical protein